MAPAIAAPFNLQAYVNPVPALALSTTEPPAQKLVEVAAVMVAVGGVFTATMASEELAEQLLALVTVTVYEPAVLAV